MPKKEPEHIDKIFKEKLEYFPPTPPPDVWESLEPAIMAPTTTWINRNGISFLLLLSYFSLVITFILVNFGNDSSYENVIRQSVITNTTNINNNVHQEVIKDFRPTANSVPAVQAEVNNSLSTTLNQSRTSITPNTISSISNNTSQDNLKTDQNTELENSYTENNGENISDQELTSNYINTKPLEKLQFPIISKSFKRFKLIEKYKNDFPEMSRMETSDPNYGRFSNIHFGIQAGKEINPLHKSTYFPLSINHFGMNLRYSTRTWIVKGGLNYAWANSEFNENVSYQTIDSVGFFNDIISITYIQQYDPISESFIMVPVYNTQQITIHDSIQHQKEEPVNHGFSYLDIPISVGYKKSYKRWDLILRVGGGLKVLMQESANRIIIPEDAFLINEESDFLYARKLNYYLSFAPEIEYHFASSWSVFVSPQFKLYPNKKLIFEAPYSSGMSTTRGIEAGIYYQIK